MIDGKEYAKQMRENAVTDNNGNIIVSEKLWQQIANIIEKQQAEIERLKSENIMAVEISFDENEIDENEIREQLEKIKVQKTICIDNTESIRAEAIKEFARKLKCGVSITSGIITSEDVDNLVKEIAGAE